MTLLNRAERATEQPGFEKPRAEAHLTQPRDRSFPLSPAQLTNLRNFQRQFMTIDAQVSQLVGDIMSNNSLWQVALAEGIFGGLGAALGLSETVADRVGKLFSELQTLSSQVNSALRSMINSKSISAEQLDRLANGLIQFYEKTFDLVEELQNYDLRGFNLARKAFEFVTDSLSVALLPIAGAGLAAKGLQAGVKGIASVARNGLGRFLSSQVLTRFARSFAASLVIFGLLGLSSEAQICQILNNLGQNPEKCIQDLQKFFQGLSEKNPGFKQQADQTSKDLENMIRRLKDRKKLDEADVARVLRYSVQAALLETCVGGVVNPSAPKGPTGGTPVKGSDSATKALPQTTKKPSAATNSSSRNNTNGPRKNKAQEQAEKPPAQMAKEDKIMSRTAKYSANSPHAQHKTGRVDDSNKTQPPPQEDHRSKQPQQSANPEVHRISVTKNVEEGQTQILVLQEKEIKFMNDNIDALRRAVQPSHDAFNKVFPKARAFTVGSEDNIAAHTQHAQIALKIVSEDAKSVFADAKLVEVLELFNLPTTGSFPFVPNDKTIEFIRTNYDSIIQVKNIEDKYDRETRIAEWLNSLAEHCGTDGSVRVSQFDAKTNALGERVLTGKGLVDRYGNVWHKASEYHGVKPEVAKKLLGEPGPTPLQVEWDVTRPHTAADISAILSKKPEEITIGDQMLSLQILLGLSLKTHFPHLNVVVYEADNRKVSFIECGVVRAKAGAIEREIKQNHQRRPNNG